MPFRLFAAFALIAASSAPAQVAAPVATYAHATPIAGSWAWRAASGGSEAVFTNSAGQAQLTIRCMRATRRVSIARTAAGAAPFLFVWTSSTTRNLPASFQPASRQLVADLAATDPLLDAIAFSRGRLAFSASGAPALVLPASPEIDRVVEDCRS